MAWCACKRKRPRREDTRTPPLFTRNLCLLSLLVFVRFSSLSVSFFLNEKELTCFFKSIFVQYLCMQIPTAWGKMRPPPRGQGQQECGLSHLGSRVSGSRGSPWGGEGGRVHPSLHHGWARSAAESPSRSAFDGRRIF